jgi:ABC-type branched-subunit amino acid transport system substrate-binding protein
MKKAKSVSVVSCLVLVLAVFFLCSSFAKEAAAQAKTLKIGLISSVTGPMAPAFKSELDAAKPTAVFMNQRGVITVGGQKYQIEIVTADDQSSPAGAVAAANKVLQEGVRFIVAPMFMVTNMAIADSNPPGMCGFKRFLFCQGLKA